MIIANSQCVFDFQFSIFRPCGLSIIGATCAFDAKKSSLQPVHFVVSCYAKSGKDFLKNLDFAAQLSAFLIEVFKIVLHPRSGIVCANG